MALLSLSEAAIESGFSVELLESLIKKCPKRNEDRLLAMAVVKGAVFVDSADLDEYRIYLREPWPAPAGKTRPRIPKAIDDDVRAECHHQCAICGAGDNGEVAHIEPVASTLNNSPDNLLLLCPNHHTKYDYGHHASSNIDREVILATKQVKRASRRRMLRFEGNVVGALRVVLHRVEKLDSALGQASDEVLRLTFGTELRELLKAIPELSSSALDAAERDQEFTDAESALLAVAPKLIKLTQRAEVGYSTEHDARTAALNVRNAVAGVIEIDEADCPHCGGQGTIGLAGDLCAYCHGDQVVSNASLAAYDQSDLDEVECPHCHGHGTTGLNNDYCTYCGGRQTISHHKAASYNPAELDEVECPHCHGQGTTGLSGSLCALCKGRQTVSGAQARDYRSTRDAG